jgi:hypothetical protein
VKLHNRIKRTTKQYIVVALICIIVIGGAASITSYLITNQIKTEYDSLLKKAESDIKANQRSIYVSARPIKAGEEITKEAVEKRTVYSSQSQETYITENEIGNLALIDIPEQTYVMRSMVTPNSVASELREVEYQVIYLGSNISSGDTVDVRLFFPNGEDYIVLTKKLIKNIAADNQTIYLWLAEEEILRMSSAIVDTYLYSGAKIYITKYIEPNLQNASFTTYEPSLATIHLIRNNPNIIETATNKLSIEVRKAMENRQAESMNTDVSSIDWELSPNQSEVIDDPYDHNKITDELQENEYNESYMDEVKEKASEMDYGP